MTRLYVSSAPMIKRIKAWHRPKLMHDGFFAIGADFTCSFGFRFYFLKWFIDWDWRTP